MKRFSLSFSSSSIAICCASAFPAFLAGPADARNYVIERIASGLDQPTYVTQAPNDPANILYYTERTQDANPGFNAANTMGSVWRYDVSSRSKTLVLDLSSRPVTQDTGLQTIAFHPEFNTPATPGYGKLYVSSSAVAGTALNRVEEFTVDLSGPTPSYAATFTRTILQYQNNRQLNHTINWVGFDPTAAGAERNYLYISTGDGSYGNPYNDGLSPGGRPSQNPNDIAGKMLRVDVAGADAYPADPLKNFAVPASNPIPTFNAANPGAPISGLGEVYLTGLRNVYRASFDRANGDLWMGDVGEVDFEEVDFLKADSNTTGPPVDFGWPQREGTSGSDVGGAPDTKINPFTGAPSLEPIQQYPHDTPAKAVIGGYVYRGPIAELQGNYFYTDFVGGNNASQIWSLDFDRNTSTASFDGNNGANNNISAHWQSLVYDPTDPSYLPDSTIANSAGLDHIVSFGEDNAGNVYLVDFGNGSGFDGQYPSAGRGEIFRIVPALSVTVTVDRNSGAMAFANETGSPIDIRGYSIASAAGSLNRDELQPVSGRLDAPPNGNGTIDPANSWQVTSPAGSQSLFSESSTGSATTLSVGESFDLSVEDGWIPSIYEDLDLRLTLGDGSIVDALVQYTGNFDRPFDRSDLDFNGTLGPSDWTKFLTHHLTDLAGVTKAESYGLGDLDGDGDNDFSDFRLFQKDFTATHGAAAFAQLLSIPEPSTLLLVLMLATGSCFRVRMRRHQLRSLAMLVAASASLIAANADAAIVRTYTFNNGTAQDSIGTAHGTLQGNAAIDFGALDLSGNDGDYLSLPAATIAVPSLVDATFEAWFTYRGGDPWQYLFGFGRTQSGVGRDYTFYTPNSGFGDNRAGLKDNNLAENTAVGGPTLTTNTPHHVAVVVDDNANGGTNRMSVFVDSEFRGDVGLSYSLSDLSSTAAYLGRSLFTADPYFNGRIEEFRIHNTALSAAEVQSSYVTGPDLFDALRLEVNTVTGAVTLKNQFTAPLTFDYYRVASAEGALAPATWKSLDDKSSGTIGGGAGESWNELGDADANEVAELFLLGGSTLVANASLDLGKLYNPAIHGTREPGNLVFQYGLQGEDDLRQGFVSYVIPPPLPGDYNDNGVVDIADYVVWRNHLDTPFQLPNEVTGVSEGSVTMADFDAWKERFGNILGGSGAAAGALSIPEPGSALLLAIGLLFVVNRNCFRWHLRACSLRSLAFALLFAGAPMAVAADAPKLLELTGDLGVHDPAMVKAGDTYYLFATGGRRNSGVVSQFTSPDMRTWSRAGTVFPELPKWVADEVPKARNAWAPDISFFNGKYHLYYSLSSFGVNHSAIALATNKTLDPSSPDFKWVDEGLVVRSRAGEDDFNSIDPNVVVDGNGRAWLSWGSFWGGIVMRELDPHSGKLSSENTTLYKLAARPRSAKHVTPPVEGAIEAPFIVQHGDDWYLFVSWDFCCRGPKSDYKVVVGRAKQVTGPYRDRDGKLLTEGGGTLILAAHTDQWRGAGHPAVYRENDVDYLLFHAYSATTGRSRLQISTIAWQDDWPQVAPLP